jgi:hypothetical protein
VVIWSIANEPDTASPAARPYFEPLVAVTRRLDPTRPVAFANFMVATPERDVVSDLFDVLLLNRYFGWYVFTGDLVAAERALEAELREWAQYGKPIVMTEYGADTQPGLHSLTSEPWSEEFQVDLLAMYHRVFDRIDAVVGEQVWNFADFATRSGISRVDDRGPLAERRTQVLVGLRGDTFRIGIDGPRDLALRLQGATSLILAAPRPRQSFRPTAACCSTCSTAAARCRAGRRGRRGPARDQRSPRPPGPRDRPG